jgi:two-component system sensor histidine kinase BaeS
MRATFSVRSRLVIAMMLVAITSVLITTVTSALTVDRSLEDFGRKDLELSADHSAAMAAELYRRDHGWTRRTAADLSRLERVQGHSIVLRDASGRILPGSAARQPSQRAIAAVVAGGTKVGELSLAHPGGGYLRLRERDGAGPLGEELSQRLRWRDILAGLAAMLLGLLVAIGLAVAVTRPLRRLTQAAERIEAGDLETPVDVESGASELRRLGHTLQRVARTLKRQEEVRRETVGDLAHELRTPVAGLRGRIEAAQDGILTDMPVQLAAMHADVLRLGRLMEDFERLAAAQQPSMLVMKQPVDLAALARDRGRAFEGFFEANGIAFILDTEPAVAHGDAERLGQVIDNLLSNALRYTDSGGRVILRVLEGRDESVVEVADTGIGIAAEDLPRVFERFWRGEKSRSRATGGSGLGLALVNELVRVHDGRMEVHSLPGRGSRFRVHLPSAAPEPQELVIFDLPPQEAPAGTCLVRLARDPGPGEWAAVERPLLARIQAGASTVILVLDNLSTFGARGAATLVSTHMQLRARDGAFVVVAADGTPARNELERAGLTQVLKIVPAIADAIETIAPRPGDPVSA